MGTFKEETISAASNNGKVLNSASVRVCIRITTNFSSLICEKGDMHLPPGPNKEDRQVVFVQCTAPETFYTQSVGTDIFHRCVL